MSLLERLENKKVYVITDSDLDGVSAHLISRYYLPQILNKVYYTITSDRTMKEFNLFYANSSEVIIFVDITPTKYLYEKLIKENKQVFVFDHHIGSYTECKLFIQKDYYFTIEKCGAKIFFDELTKDRRVKKIIYQYIELVDSYDRWLDSSALWKQAKNLHNIMCGYVDWKLNFSEDLKYEKFVQAQLNKFNNEKYYYFTSYEEELAKKAEKKERDNIALAKKSIKFRKDNSGNEYIYFECSSKLSYVANLLLKQYPKYKYIVGHSTYLEDAKKELNGKISLRCFDGFDVSIIAQKHSGNGDTKASGIDLPLEEFKKLQKGEKHLI